MKTATTSALAVALALFMACGGVATAARDTAVKKQRIAIEGTFNSGAAKGSFKLIPLTPGPLKKDSGRFQTAFVGAPGNEISFIRNGQQITTASGGGRDRMTGKNGTFSLAPINLEGVSAGGTYTVFTARWTFESGTGVYEGLGGGGAVVFVTLPGHDTFRYEGYVRAA